ncbi:MAG TPA: type 4a pilus biogenesis protein PilO [Patescibacteria group bacterium]|jgi:Tfp pilus assembly protein PilO|nr:type 4a pilus biogenesis protein PilO [Patescibacteria group bacterium]
MLFQDQKRTGLKKRQQIEHANRRVFLWVAIASVALSFLLVLTQFFYQKWAYNNRVIDAKTKTSNTLTQNLSNATALRQNINALVGNQDLASVKTNPADSNLKIVLDALPSRLDTTALATSLQAITSLSGVAIENIDVPGSPSQDASQTSSSPIEQKFSIVVTGTYDKIRGMVVDLERSIRPIKITNLQLTGSDTSLRAAIDGVTYYQASKTVTISQKVIK